MRQVVVGLQFGDEGKGKITDFLTGKDTIIVRYNGGTNAGHTVSVDGKEFKFHLMPAGSLVSQEVFLGNGMVIDPFAFLQEYEKIREENPELKVHISEGANVVTEIHKFIDRAEEESRENRIGTTSHGIGPTYEEKYSRNGIRIEDLGDKEKLVKKIKLLCRTKKSLLEKSNYSDPAEIDRVAASLYSVWEKIKDYVERTEITLWGYVDSDRNMLFEGANGALLDIDFGTYPFVTSSNTISGAIHNGSGVSMRKIHRVVGVAKAYTTRVGEGPFPTELSGKDGEKLRESGSEYGTTTGRPRRVGWLDLPILKYTTRLNDVDILAITKIDVLGSMKEIKVCKDYGKDRGVMEVLQGKVKANPQYEIFDGWGNLAEDEKSMIIERGKGHMPEEMEKYISFIEKIIEKPVKIISLGKNRKTTLVRE
ncbi:adenylosuccinate synthase [Caldiplasma sukawensis]